MGHAGQSFRLACLAGKNPGSKDPRLLRDRPSDGAALQRNLCRILSTIENVLRLTDKRNQIAQRPAAPNQAADNQSDAITKKNTAH